MPGVNPFQGGNAGSNPAGLRKRPSSSGSGRRKSSLLNLSAFFWPRNQSVRWRSAKAHEVGFDSPLGLHAPVI